MIKRKLGQAMLLMLMTTAITLSLAPPSERSLTEDLGDEYVQCNINNETFLDGEQVVYKIFYNWGFIWLQAGEVRFKVTETDDEYHISVIGHTYESYDKFYRVRDTFETYLDKESLLPKLFIRDIEEGKYKHYNRFEFDQENNKVYSYEGKTIDSLELTEWEVANCMHDILSILYFVRNMEFDTLRPGQSFPIEIFLEETYPLTVRILEKDKKKKVKGFGKFNTHVFSPELIDGKVFKKKDQMVIYVSADSNKLPVAIETPLSVGKVKAFLMKHRGLRYDLDATLN